MENFCKGMLWGVVLGTCVGAIVVAKNKKLSQKLNKGIEIAEEKIIETKEALEEKLNDGVCNCLNKSSSYEDGFSDAQNNDSGGNSQNNKFSKKNKIC